MPRYAYKCKNCTVSFESTHSYRDTLVDCVKCKVSGSLIKIMSPIKINNQFKASTAQKAGEVVEEHIEDNKNILLGLKGNLKKRVYKK